MRKKEDYPAICLRMPAELKKKVEKAAQKEKRSVTNYIIVTLEKAVRDGK